MSASSPGCSSARPFLHDQPGGGAEAFDGIGIEAHQAGIDEQRGRAGRERHGVQLLNIRFLQEIEDISLSIGHIDAVPGGGSV